MFKYIFAAMLAAAISTSASAGLITFDFEDVPSSSTHNQLVYSQNGVSLTITAFNQNDSSAQVHSNEDGLGVVGINTSGVPKRIGNGEYLVFELTGADGMRFTDFELIFPTQTRWEGNAVQLGDHLAVSYGDQAYDYTHALATKHESTSFNTSLANGGQFIVSSNSGDGIRVAGVSFSTQVPEPSTIALLGLTLIAFSFS